jgi:uncharacterized protein (TIGR02246 family)
MITVERFIAWRHSVVPKTPPLREEDKNFEEAYNKHDAAAIAALFTDDAVLVTPRGTFTGRAAIEKKYEEEDFETYNGSDMVSTTERITAVGNELHLPEGLELIINHTVVS